MYGYFRKSRKSGFTLAELLIVVAIIAVLVAVSIPIFTASLERAKANVCETNRKTLLRQMVYEKLSEGSLSEEDAKKIVDNSDAYCPVGGTYTVHVTDFLMTVECSISAHGKSSSGAEDIVTKNSGTYLTDFTDFVKNYDDGKGLGNDRIRAAFLKENGGEWPTITVDGISYIVQPFYKETSSATELSDRVWLYAKAATDKGNWTTRLIYVDNKWYGITDYWGNPNLSGPGAQTSQATKYDSVESLRNDVLNSTKGTGDNAKPAWYEVTGYTESFKK